MLAFDPQAPTIGVDKISRTDEWKFVLFKDESRIGLYWVARRIHL